MSATTAYVGPNQQRSLRACMVCSIVQLQGRFMSRGCPNCDDFLGMRGSQDTVSECTSQVFEGLITVADPKTSWVARWQRLDNYVPGVYATKVVGALSEEAIAAAEGAGIKYIPRDGSAQEDEPAA
ncbi:putative transcriptional elongation protein Spt4 [Lineolata rhizophorae]|uniref:Transcription elongation factor SPT4 n=1 Tax=Lineolata rhizophorae TaxID=578093 RepID=A0A6A6PEM2_9PEZI|nr:putative transcriptional elongation protein Spt4 [Lineolata rhizophorae]